MPDNWPGRKVVFQPVPKESDHQPVVPRTLLDALAGANGASQKAIAQTGLDLVMLLLEKNRAYGDSARQPISCFAQGIDTRTRMAVRMDDKISRLMRGDNSTFNEDAITDLAGYLVLYLSLGES